MGTVRWNSCRQWPRCLKMDDWLEHLAPQNMICSCDGLIECCSSWQMLTMILAHPLAKLRWRISLRNRRTRFVRCLSVTYPSSNDVSGIMLWAGAWNILLDSSRDWWRSIKRVLGRTSSVLSFYVSSWWMRTCVLVLFRFILDCLVYQANAWFCQVSLSQGIRWSWSLVCWAQSLDRAQSFPPATCCLWVLVTAVIRIVSLSLMHRLREHERKKEDIYEDLPLFVIERDYGSTEAGKTLASQGCIHIYIDHVCCFL